MQTALTAPGESKLTTERPKRRFPLSFLVLGIIILGAVIYLIFANTQANEVYYMTVPELHQCTTCNGQSVRVAGVVQAGSIVRNDQQQSVSFVLEDGKQTMAVAYKGVVPDIFHDGIQVVVEGPYSSQGAFQAHTLLAKCPSKFQSATPTAR
ncbi:cytochrome c maturation protein CcmE [Tengunoibacter tsumagoiensis]|uniref:Cytochrome c biogenesis protein CcmE n=1 Tax=Tengunoibacter tsumagoiensis TaxID=2014871 RepID=A0A402A5M0_9CHLR|nr:cytochrome c maturation protein CcmE [Tengunoibacter tsumagoiensis]GCE14379.1 hypothetical protein KTT_42380 [Tengunoibacter tsumagoiensis]